MLDNPDGSNKKANFLLMVVLPITVVIGICLIVIGVKAVVNKPPPPPPNSISPSTSLPATPSPSPSTSSPPYTTSPELPSGEQLSQPPERRPTQYLHVCLDTATGVAYVTQGTPNCLPGGNFQENYDPSVPGTALNVPCQAGSGATVRYAYIAPSDSCPSGTNAVK